MADISKGNLLRGQQYDPQDDLVTPFTEQVVNHAPGAGPVALGNARTEIVPEDAAASRVRVYSPPTSTLDSYVLSYPTTVNLSGAFPDVLSSITTTYNTSGGDGMHTNTGHGVAAGSNPSLSLSADTRSQATTSVMPDVIINITQKWAQNVPAIVYLFYINSSATMSSILTRLTSLAGSTVSAWPKFNPVAHTLTLKGQQMTVSVEGNVQQHIAVQGSDVTYTDGTGSGRSTDAGVTIRSVRIPPTIHGAITISSASSGTVTNEASAEADRSSGTGWPAMTTGTLTATTSVVGSVSPSSLSATTPASIPTTGLYLQDVIAEPYKWGRARVRATVVNFADL